MLKAHFLLGDLENYVKKQAYSGNEDQNEEIVMSLLFGGKYTLSILPSFRGLLSIFFLTH